MKKIVYWGIVSLAIGSILVLIGSLLKLNAKDYANYFLGLGSLLDFLGVLILVYLFNNKKIS